MVTIMLLHFLSPPFRPFFLFLLVLCCVVEAKVIVAPPSFPKTELYSFPMSKHVGNSSSLMSALNITAVVLDLSNLCNDTAASITYGGRFVLIPPATSILFPCSIDPDNAYTLQVRLALVGAVGSLEQADNKQAFAWTYNRGSAWFERMEQCCSSYIAHYTRDGQEKYQALVDHLKKHGNEAQAVVEYEPNPWGLMYESPFYQLIFRGLFPLLYLSAAIAAARYGMEPVLLSHPSLIRTYLI